MQSRRILFITRKYPPVRGGMERYSSELFRAWAEREDVTLVANPAGNSALPAFLARCAALLARHAQEFDQIHLADALLSALIPLVRARSRARISVTVHGLDITFRQYGYQFVVPRLVASADRVVCVSTHTARACAERGISPDRTVVIPNGIDLASLARNDRYTPPQIAKKYRFALDRPILFSVGRLVKRKGHAWFVRHQLPALRSRFLFVIAGEGPEKSAIERAATEVGAASDVRLLGAIDDEERAFWLDTAYAYLMPNISVPNDPEGFGISCLEAVAHRLPVCTTGIEGLADQMRYCYPLEELLKPELPKRTPAEWKELRATIDWKHVVEAYLRET